MKAPELVSFHTDAVWDTLGNLSFKVASVYADDQTITKTISFDDYKALLFGAQKEVTKFFPFETPQYFFKGAISNQPGTFKVILFVPAAKKQFVSTNLQIAAQVPYPNLLFYLEYRDRKCMEKLCFAVADDKPCPESALYNYPYGNVSLSGEICMGNIAVKLDSMSQAHQFVDAFFAGIDEGHYYEPGVMAVPSLSEGKLIEKVMSYNTFPKEWLVNTKSHIRKIRDLDKNLM